MDTIFLQVTEPPADFLGFLLWFVAILVGVVGTMFYLLKAAMTDRISDRDATIAELRSDLVKVEGQRDRLMEEVKSSMDTSNQVFQKVIEILKK